MLIQAALLPLFVEVALTFVLFFWTGVSRRRDAGAYSYRDELELPVLFYVLTILSIQTRHADLIFVLLAWVFVVLRILHALAHTNARYDRYRSGAFVSSAIVLAAMWAIFVVRVLLGI
jgi:hypothetical protein